MTYKVHTNAVPYVGAGGYHKYGLAKAPDSTMFKRAGGGDTQPKKSTQDNMVETVTAVAKQLSTALSPPASTVSAGSGTSPAREINSRSKCYKQLVDLKNLKVNGI